MRDNNLYAIFSEKVEEDNNNELMKSTNSEKEMKGSKQKKRCNKEKEHNVKEMLLESLEEYVSKEVEIPTTCDGCTKNTSKPCKAYNELKEETRIISGEYRELEQHTLDLEKPG